MITNSISTHNNYYSTQAKSAAKLDFSLTIVADKGIQPKVASADTEAVLGMASEESLALIEEKQDIVQIAKSIIDQNYGYLDTLEMLKMNYEDAFASIDVEITYGEPTGGYARSILYLGALYYKATNDPKLSSQERNDIVGQIEEKITYAYDTMNPEFDHQGEARATLLTGYGSKGGLTVVIDAILAGDLNKAERIFELMKEGKFELYEENEDESSNAAKLIEEKQKKDLLDVFVR